MAEMIYNLLLLLAPSTIHNPAQLQVFTTMLEFAKKTEGNYTGYEAIKNASLNLENWGLKETPLAIHLKSWVAMH